MTITEENLDTITGGDLREQAADSLLYDPEESIQYYRGNDPVTGETSYVLTVGSPRSGRGGWSPAGHDSLWGDLIQAETGEIRILLDKHDADGNRTVIDVATCQPFGETL